MSIDAEITLENTTYSIEVEADGRLDIYVDNEWAGNGRWDGEIRDCAADLGDDVYEALDRVAALAIADADADPIITEHVREWGNTGPRGQLSIGGGFVSWCWDVRQETRTALADGEFDQLASDVAYSVDSAYRSDLALRAVTDEEAAEWLAYHRDELIEAIDESLND